MLKSREETVELRSSFFFRKVIRIRYVIDKEIQHGILGDVYKLASRVAPLAVLFVVCAVGLLAYKLVLVKRHSAALTDKLPGASEDSIYGYVELLRQQKESVGIRLSLACLPSAACLVTKTLSAS